MKNLGLDLVDKRAAGAMHYSQLAVGEVPLSEAEGTETYPVLSNGAYVQLFAERCFFVYEALGDYNPSLLNFDDKKQFFFSLLRI